MKETLQIKNPIRKPFHLCPCDFSSPPRVSSLLLHTVSLEVLKPPSSPECTLIPTIVLQSRSCRGYLFHSFPHSVLRVSAAVLHLTVLHIFRRSSLGLQHPAVRSAAEGQTGSEAPKSSMHHSAPTESRSFFRFVAHIRMLRFVFTSSLFMFELSKPSRNRNNVDKSLRVSSCILSLSRLVARLSIYRSFVSIATTSSMKMTQLSILLHSCRIELSRLSLSPYHLLITLSSGICLQLTSPIESHTKITLLS